MTGNLTLPGRRLAGKLLEIIYNIGKKRFQLGRDPFVFMVKQLAVHIDFRHICLHDKQLPGPDLFFRAEQRQKGKPDPFFYKADDRLRISKFNNRLDSQILLR